MRYESVNMYVCMYVHVRANVMEVSSRIRFLVLKPEEC